MNPPPPPPPHHPQRTRTLPLSCLPCKARRTRCDLTHPTCHRCTSTGLPCTYTPSPTPRTRSRRPRPVSTVPVSFQPVMLFPPSSTRDDAAVLYFHGRLWPLLTASEEPSSPAVGAVVRDRVVRLAASLMAEAHRFLQDRRSAPVDVDRKRRACIEAVNLELDRCSASRGGVGRVRGMKPLLFAILLLYFYEGYMVCEREGSTLVHSRGVRATVDAMGGLGSVLAVGDRSLSVLTCLFATADLTTKMLRGGAACLSPSSWRLFPPDSVWWQEHVVDDAAPSSPAPSLAGAFEQMSHMLIYRQSIVENNNTLSMDRIKAFELALQPSYSPFTFSDLDGSDVPSNSEMVSHHAFLRAYQHTALVYLYRAVCGLPAGHPQVQQHINACLDAIDAVPRKSKILNCLVFPLCVAGAHLRAAQRQRRVLGILLAIQNQLKFTSLKQIAEFLESCWRKEPGNSSWLDTFATLNVNVISF